ncbi:MAG: protein kinase domain-containing protein, partial [Gemmatimonadota bacterium]
MALKVLAPEMALGVGAERFVREIQIAANLNHPHIVPLLDSGVAEDRPYYVMPFVEGESLRERLTREGPLPVDQALRLARDVTGALRYAHDHGVIHRDIKPGNILLTEGGAVVTDFGIASAIGAGGGDHLTQTGHSVGTVGYMSPEQASGDVEIDGRADQYSVACVLFEMLTGEPPFAGRTARAVLGRQLSQPVPDVTALRDSVPRELDTVLRRALARMPADRYATTGEFASALGKVAHGSTVVEGRRPLNARPAIWVALAVAIVLAAVPWLIPNLGGPRAASPAEVEADTTRYAIFPFWNRAGERIDLDEVTLLRDALARWQGISIVGRAQLGDAMFRSGESFLDPATAARIALDHGAGRFLAGDISLDGSTVRIEAGLYGPGARPIASETARFPVSLHNPDSVFVELVDALLFPGSPRRQLSGPAGTRSFPARKAFNRGMAAIEQWQLDVAEAAFDEAARADSEFGRAHLWLALSRAWSDQDPARWVVAARQAGMHRDAYTALEAAMAEAVLAQSNREYGVACPTWREITATHSFDYAGWYGLAICLARDDVVLRDPDSPSGWRFRSSQHEAIGAYRAAFARLPAILESFYSNSFRSLRKLFYLSGNTSRIGESSPPEARRFRAHPEWRGDTLAFVPVPVPVPGTPARVAYSFDPASEEAAVAALRRTFADVALAWETDAPNSARAVAALAIGLGMLGDRTSLDTLVRARSMAATPRDSLQLAATETWLRLAFGLPSEVESLRRARMLADSLLAADSAQLIDPNLGSELAALLGRGASAAAYARQLPGSPHSNLPPAIQADARALGLFAALGGPRDSLLRLEARVAGAIGRLPEPERMPERGSWLALPASMSFPHHEFDTVADLEFDWVVAAQMALARA